MQLHIDSAGTVRCVYAETLDLLSLGKLQIQRASYVETDATGHSQADLGPVGGPTLGPYPLRSEALAAEHR